MASLIFNLLIWKLIIANILKMIKLTFAVSYQHAILQHWQTVFPFCSTEQSFTPNPNSKDTIHFR